MPEDETTTSSEAPSESTPVDRRRRPRRRRRQEDHRQEDGRQEGDRQEGGRQEDHRQEDRHEEDRGQEGRRDAQSERRRRPPAPPAVLFQVPDPIDKPKKKAAKKARQDGRGRTPPGRHEAAEADEKPAKKTAKKAAKKAATKAAEQARTRPADHGRRPEPSPTTATGRTATGTGGAASPPPRWPPPSQDLRRGRRGRLVRRRRGRRRAARSDEDEAGDGTSRRRRRRRRTGEDGGGSSDDPSKTVTRVRRSRTGDDQITAVSGSTRLEAKKQRRREGREAGRRRAPIVSEAEFLARREAVDRVMVVRQRDELTQIGVLEDKVLVEHYVARESQTSLIGNVYLGRVQNVLPSMEAAFIDIGRGRNAVLYAGEVNWSALGHKDGQPRKIESVLSSGQSDPGPGHQGPDRPQGRPADQPDQPGRPVPGLRARRHHVAGSPASCPTPSATGSRRCSRRSSPTPPA